jgi:hypothetical protein
MMVGRWREARDNNKVVRYNQELYGLYNEPDIIKMVKAARLRWLGHLYRT